jgi:uncharacterized protein HemY
MGTSNYQWAFVLALVIMAAVTLFGPVIWIVRQIIQLARRMKRWIRKE